jgi:beta-galactosidase/beta-glucuronidase
VSAPAYASSGVTPHGATPAAGLTADAVVSPTVDVLATADAVATFRLIAADGVTVVGTTNASGKGASTLVAPPMAIAAAELWSVARPYLYTLEVALTNKAGSVDAVNTSIGIRDIAFDAQRGMFVNQQAVKMRGFCEHESFAGVGGALPDRIDLFRLQQMRGVGGNAWRTSHNPPEPVLLDLADRLGVLVLDENRVLASQENCVGLHCRNVPTYAGDPAADMGALALRDRNHASVFAYSLCASLCARAPYRFHSATPTPTPPPPLSAR